MIQKISKLLALAQGASTQAEAEACFAKAQSLATAHSISLAQAQHLSDAAEKQQPIHRTITIGLPRKRANKHLVNLMYAIALANDVEMNIAHNSTYVVMFGYPSDIDMCEQLWIQIAQRMVQFADQFLRDITSNKQVARSSYYAGFIDTMRRRLADSRAVEVARAEAATQTDRHHPEPSATSLALRHKSATIRDYYKQNSAARGTWRGDRHHGKRSAHAARAGGLAARQVVLPSGSEIAGGRRSISKADAY
ncbi:MAG: DUF2786 domain-containing protein [Actinomycetia bacterium]|nr:DUF2786 domain-containing protein [Actinomycetes bacterium]